MNTGTLNLAWSDAFIAALVSAGLRHCVLAPGARSAPLALAALRRTEIQCHVINDERAAAFFALGIGKATGLPAAILTTSGTAAANLLPAIMEAHLAHVPLLAITADRPPEALGWGVNQSVDQIKLYGDQVRAFHGLATPTDPLDNGHLSALAARLIHTTRVPLPGPVHVNVPFREPLLPDTIPVPPPLSAPLTIHAAETARPSGLTALAAALSGQPGIILCGEAAYPPGFAPAIAQLAAALDAPIIAEALSNMRCGPHDSSHLITHAAHFLRHTHLPVPAWVLRFGRFPVSRVVERWLATLSEAKHIQVAAAGDWPDPLRQCTMRIEADPQRVAEDLRPLLPPVTPSFSKAWLEAEAAHSDDTAFFEGAIARTLITSLPSNTHVFIGNSLAIRAMDTFGGRTQTPLTLHGNRGASGIDGNLATCAGIAAATEQPIVAFVGDQTLLHDASSLALLARRNAIIVLLDNGGGRIFEHLPFAPTLPPDVLTRGWQAPATVDFSALAIAYGLHYQEATNPQGLSIALKQALQGGAWLLRVVIDPADSHRGFTT